MDVVCVVVVGPSGARGSWDVGSCEVRGALQVNIGPLRMRMRDHLLVFGLQKTAKVQVEQQERESTRGSGRPLTTRPNSKRRIHARPTRDKARRRRRLRTPPTCRPTEESCFRRACAECGRGPTRCPLAASVIRTLRAQRPCGLAQAFLETPRPRRNLADPLV